jgi:hypothetical protein
MSYSIGMALLFLICWKIVSFSEVQVLYQEALWKVVFAGYILFGLYITFTYEVALFGKNFWSGYEDDYKPGFLDIVIPCMLIFMIISL